MMTDPTPQHRWLQQLIGEWEFTSECSCGPDAPPLKSKGSERVRTLGDLWVIGEGGGEMPGGAR